MLDSAKIAGKLLKILHQQHVPSVPKHLEKEKMA